VVRLTARQAAALTPDCRRKTGPGILLPELAHSEPRKRSEQTGGGHPVFNLGTLSHLISIVDSVLETINGWVRGTKGWRRKLQLELQSNIELIFSYVRYDLPVDDVIANLRTAHIKTTLESGFNFNTLKRGRVTESVTGKQPQYQQYVGWTTERLFSNILVKIEDLQTIVKMDPQNERIRKGVRLINILKLMLLIMKHINA
jgi:hypothetical protein